MNLFLHSFFSVGCNTDCDNFHQHLRGVRFYEILVIKDTFSSESWVIFFGDNFISFISLMSNMFQNLHITQYHKEDLPCNKDESFPRTNFHLLLNKLFMETYIYFYLAEHKTI